jgi:hypothetical protein
VSVYRSYFSKNNTLIQNNELNVSQNPVGEISYGTSQKTVSRIIFKVDLDDLQQKIANEGIDQSNIVSHRLHLVNTIAEREYLIGGYSYSQILERASSFELNLFTLVEDWDEGSGYKFLFNDDALINLPKGASNWLFKKTGMPWAQAGGFFTGSTGVTGITGVSTVIGNQFFQKGNENINIDVTNYINNLLFSGTTDYGLGLKLIDLIESAETLNRKSVAFHMKNTNTVYEPYIETIIEDTVSDDRNFFFMDKDNDLYLYSNKGDVTVSGVTIYDYNDQVYDIIPASAVTRVKTGIYKISLNVDSADYPDAVIFRDVWTVIQNSKIKNINNQFYLVESNKFYSFGASNRLNPDNYHFSYFGINSQEYLRRGDKRRIEIEVKQLYKNLDSNLPLNIEYRLFMKQSNDVEIDIIPYTLCDRTPAGYEFILDTTWLIPQDYYLDVKISDGAVFSRKAPMKFTIVSDDAFTKS